MPPELKPAPPLKVRWNQVTWYSKLGAIVMFLGIIPGLCFYVGMQYELTTQTLNQEAALIPATPIQKNHIESAFRSDAPQGETAASSQVIAQWMPFSQLPEPPKNMQMEYWPEGSRVPIFKYDGSVPRDKLIDPKDPHYPDADTIKLTAFLHSELKVTLPAGADVTAIFISESGHFLKDGTSVYYSDCEGFGCGYNLLVGADPSSFEEKTTAIIDHTEVVIADDKNYSYTCTSVECTAQSRYSTQ